MKNLEVICFRFMILLILASLVGFGSGWLYKTKQAHGWQEVVSSSHARMNETAAKCETERDATSSCDFFKIFRENFDHSVKGRDEAKRLANLLFALMYILPLTAIALFYSLRWVFTGKLKPVFPKLNVI